MSSSKINKTKRISYEVKLIDFVASDYASEDFVIQMFGINEFRKTFSITVEDFEPFVYIKVGNNWKQSDVEVLLSISKTILIEELHLTSKRI